MPLAAGQARAVAEVEAEVVTVEETVEPVVVVVPDAVVAVVAVVEVLVDEGQAEGPVAEGSAYMLRYPPLPQYSVELPAQVIVQFVTRDETLEHATVLPQ